MAQAIRTPGHGLPEGIRSIENDVDQAAPEVLVLGSDERIYDENLKQIADRLSGLANQQVSAKALIEQRMIRAVRRFHGIYEPSDLLTMTGSTAYVGATRAKTVALEARLFDLIFPTDDRNWATEPTPVPKLSKEVKEAELRAQNAARQANEAEAAGDPRAQEIVEAGQDEAGRAQAATAEIENCKKCAKLMQEEIDDQLVESQYPAQSRLMIHDACQLGTGILKGPMVNEKSRGRWLAQGEGGEHSLVQNEDVRPLVRRVDPWSFFPDMSASTIEEAEFTFERYLWTASDLRKMVKTHGFDPAAIRELLRERKPMPNTSPSLSNLVQLRALTEDSTASGGIKGRFVGWEYHGPLESEEIAAILTATGEADLARQYELEDDPLREQRVILYFCEGAILKLSPEYPLDTGDTLYSVFNIEKAEASIFGYGIPDIMADSQDALNSGWRMVLDNGAFSVGPQVVLDKEAIEPVDQSWVMRAKKVWLRVKAAVPHTPDPITFFNVPNNTAALGTILTVVQQFIDMETGIPQPQQGEQGAHTTQTVGGMAILQNAANVVFRRTVKNFDDGIISPLMRRFYDWNMQFNPKAEIKGDMQVDARGTSVLLLKEIQASNLMLIVTGLMANPNIAPMLKPFPAVAKLFQAMMIKPDEVMTSEDEYKAAMEAAAQNPPPDPAQIQAESRIQVAQLAQQTAQLREETARMLAESHRQIALMEMQARGEISMEEMRTKIAEKQIDVEAGDRRMITEAALERRMAAEARARGDEPAGSGGNFSAGEENGKK